MCMKGRRGHAHACVWSIRKSKVALILKASKIVVRLKYYTYVYIFSCFWISDPTFALKLKLKLLSRVRLFAIPWAVAYQAPQSMEFSRQEYWSYDHNWNPL